MKFLSNGRLIKQSNGRLIKQSNGNFMKQLMKASIFSVFSLWATMTLGTSILTMNTQELTRTADVIVFGTVTQILVNEKTNDRSALIEAFETPKCPSDLTHLREFQVQLLGRTLPGGEIVEKYLGAPELLEGEKLVLYLKRVRNINADQFTIVGFHQGKLKVLKDARGVRRVAGPLELPPTFTTKQFPPQTQSTPKKTFLSQDFPAIPKTLRQAQGPLPTLDEVLNLARQSHAELSP